MQNSLNKCSINPVKFRLIAITNIANKNLSSGIFKPKACL